MEQDCLVGMGVELVTTLKRLPYGVNTPPHRVIVGNSGCIELRIAFTEGMFDRTTRATSGAPSQLSTMVSTRSDLPTWGLIFSKETPCIQASRSDTKPNTHNIETSPTHPLPRQPGGDHLAGRDFVRTFSSPVTYMFYRAQLKTYFHRKVQEFTSQGNQTLAINNRHRQLL